MKISKFIKLCSFIVFFLTFSSCKKNFLDEKPNSAIILPTTLDEFQMLMENMTVHGFTINLPLLSSDELEYINYDTYLALRQNVAKNTYIWNKDIFGGEINTGDWNNQYTSIFYANNVIAGLSKIPRTPENDKKWKFLFGWAHYCRAFAYFDLVKNFSPPYDLKNAKTLLGVPLRLNPSIDEIMPRSTQEQTYDRIFTDLDIALNNLEPAMSLNKNQPTKITCYALGARIYLSMGEFIKSETYADNCLTLYNKLTDYNAISLTDANPFRTIDTELLYHTTAPGVYTSLTVTTANNNINIPQRLISLYNTNDLRLPIYFARRANGTYVRKRGYQRSGSYTSTGLATDEIYLIKAECAARRDDVATSTKYLNDLLVKRFKTGTFAPINITDPSLLLDKVLEERQKELIWRGLRWDDIRRLNKLGANFTLSRLLNGVTYALLPNDVRFTFPIPDNELMLSGIQQNIR